MISEDDARRTRRFDDYYVINPVLASWQQQAELNGEKLPEGYAYQSDTNDLWLGVEELRELLATL